MSTSKCILITIIACSFIFKNSRSQEIKRGNNWVTGFGPVVKFQFTTSFQVDTFQHVYFTKCSSVISDTDGNYQFYCTGFYMMDKNGDIMSNGANVNCPKGTVLADYYGGSSLFSQTSIILPRKGNTYYVFSTGMSDSVANNYLNHIKTEFDVLNYSVVDMDGNSGKGSVIEKNKILLENQHYVSCALTAVRHSNGKDWWLVKADCNNNLYQLFCVKEDTIIGPIFKTITSPGDFCHFFSQIYFSEDGSKMASSIYGRIIDTNFYDFNRVDLYDFDRCTGDITYKNHYYVPYDTSSYPDNDYKSGISFSPNGNLLYESNFYTIYQVDLTDTNKNNALLISGPDTSLSYFPKYSTLGLAPNNKIYIGNWNGTRKFMSYIDSPDVKGLGCHFVANGVWQPYTNLLEPPNMPYFGLGIDSSNLGCWTVGIHQVEEETKSKFSFYPNPANGVLNIEWSEILSDDSRLVLYNSIGQQVYFYKLNTRSGFIQLDISHYSKGLYYLKIDNSIKKVILE